MRTPYLTTETQKHRVQDFQLDRSACMLAVHADDATIEGPRWTGCQPSACIADAPEKEQTLCLCFSVVR
jgi:hypothetical protein